MRTSWQAAQGCASRTGDDRLIPPRCAVCCDTAGGDVRAIAEAGQSGGSLTADFFREEYELDYRLATMGVPHVALIDGITMGTLPCTKPRGQ